MLATLVGVTVLLVGDRRRLLSGHGTWLRPADGVVMVYVSAGEFQMGSDDDGVDYAMQLCSEYDDDCGSGQYLARPRETRFVWNVTDTCGPTHCYSSENGMSNTCTTPLLKT